MNLLNVVKTYANPASVVNIPKNAALFAKIVWYISTKKIIVRIVAIFVQINASNAWIFVNYAFNKYALRKEN